MGIARRMAHELVRELDNKSREFYEFVMPAIDMIEQEDTLVVTIDLPGFSKKDISLQISGNILHIMATRESGEITGTVHQRHRPAKIDKKVIIPISVGEDEKVVGKATYVDGVVTLKIPMESRGTNIPIS